MNKLAISNFERLPLNFITTTAMNVGTQSGQKKLKEQ